MRLKVKHSSNHSPINNVGRRSNSPKKTTAATAAQALTGRSSNLSYASTPAAGSGAGSTLRSDPELPELAKTASSNGIYCRILNLTFCRAWVHALHVNMYHYLVARPEDLAMAVRPKKVERQASDNYWAIQAML